MTGANAHSPDAIRRSEDDASAQIFHLVNPATGAPHDRVADEVVLIHGWACDLSDWEPLIGGLSTISQVIAVDLPGHGRSEPSPSGHTVSTMAAHVLSLMDYLQLERVVLVGHSSGAEVAAMLAVRRPDRVRAVVSIDPSYGFPPDRKAAIEAMSTKLNSGDTAKVVRDFFAHLDDNEATPPWIAENHEKSARACRPAVAREMFHAFAFGEDAFHFAPTTAAFLKDRRWPLLGIYRSSDRASSGKELVTTPHDRVYIYEGAGHWLHQEQPARFITDVRTWLLSLPQTDQPRLGGAARPRPTSKQYSPFKE